MYKYTHVDIVKKIIDNIEPNITILDPLVSKFDIDGSFYKHFPEITNNKYCGFNGADNFFDYNERVDYIISHNVPTMIVGEQLWNVILKSISIVNKEIYLLLDSCGIDVFTNKRIKIMNDKGFYLNMIKFLEIKRVPCGVFVIRISKQKNKDIDLL
jgi:hypothetical protein